MTNALNAETRAQWDAKSTYWDNMMGNAGNDFHRELVVPAVEHLLDLQPDELVLDVACGTGLMSRRLALKGARVVGFDFSEGMIARARARYAADRDRIEYHIIDAMDEAAMLVLGEDRFSAAVCTMGIMDMVDIAPMLRAVYRLLKPDGRFVWSILHPVLNTGAVSRTVEQTDVGGKLEITRLLRVFDYLHIPPQLGVGAPDEPNPHYYFDRPLHELINTFAACGFALNGLEERTFSGEIDSSRELSLRNFQNFPQLMAGRLIKVG